MLTCQLFLENLAAIVVATALGAGFDAIRRLAGIRLRRRARKRHRVGALRGDSNAIAPLDVVWIIGDQGTAAIAAGRAFVQHRLPAGTVGAARSTAGVAASGRVSAGGGCAASRLLRQSRQRQQKRGQRATGFQPTKTDIHGFSSRAPCHSHQQRGRQPLSLQCKRGRHPAGSARLTRKKNGTRRACRSSPCHRSFRRCNTSRIQPDAWSCGSA